MLNFTFSIPTEVFFGKDQIKVLGKQIKRHKGSQVLICYGSDRIKRNGLFDTVHQIFKENGVSYVELSGIEPNPKLDIVKKGINLCRENDVDFVLAIGGGSIIDAAKIIAAGYYYDGSPWDFFTRKAKIKKALPIATILTLAGTGSESNANAVISNKETEQKLVISANALRPKFSILDPTYTYTVPAYLTAAGVVDTISHVFEQYFSPTKDTYLQDRLADAILKTCIKYGPIALNNPEDYIARANLMWSATLGLNSLLSYGKITDWGVHMIEHEISAIYDNVTHGVGLAILIPHWMEYAIDDSTIDKFYNLAVNVFGIHPENDKFKVGQEGIKKVKNFLKSLGMPEKLSEVNVQKERLEEIAEKAVFWGELGNFKKLAREDVLEILTLSF